MTYVSPFGRTQSQQRSTEHGLWGHLVLRHIASNFTLQSWDSDLQHSQDGREASGSQQASSESIIQAQPSRFLTHSSQQLALQSSCPCPITSYTVPTIQILLNKHLTHPLRPHQACTIKHTLFYRVVVPTCPSTPCHFPLFLHVAIVH